MEGLSGIYQIRNIINNKVYIGKSKSLKIRLNIHLSSLKNNKHHSFHLQKSVNKYGIENFEYSILEYCNEHELLEKEECYINYYNSTNRNKGYNILKSEELIKLQSKNAHIRNLKFGNLDKARLKSLESRKKKVYQFTLDGSLINSFNSIKEISDNLNIDSSGIVKCCKNKIKYFKGFVFSYNNIFNPKVKLYNNKIKVLEILNNNEKIYNSIPEFCKMNNIKDPSVIHLSLKTRNGNYKNFKIEKI